MAAHDRTAPTRRSPAGRARPVRKPRQGAGRDRGRPGDGERRRRAQSVGGNPGRRAAQAHGRRILMSRAAASSLRRRSTISASIRRAASASMSAPRPAASPRCCWSAAPGGSMRSMSAAGNCMQACARGREVVVTGRNRHPHALPCSLRSRRRTWSPSTSASSRSSWCCPPRWRWLRRRRSWSR